MSTYQETYPVAGSMQEAMKLQYTAKTHTSGGRRGGVSRSDDGLFVSVNLLYAAIFAKFAGVPQSVALFTQMSQAVYGLISQLILRLGSGLFEIMVAVLFPIPKTARMGGRLVILWMTAIILSHIFVLGYGWFFVDALVLTLLAVSYLLLTRKHSQGAEPEGEETTAAFQTNKH